MTNFFYGFLETRGGTTSPLAHFTPLSPTCYEPRNVALTCFLSLPPGSLKERHINDKDKLYAIFTPRQNLVNSIVMRNPTVEETPGEDTVRCHIMFKVSVNVF